MAIIPGKTPEALTPDEITWITNAAVLALKYLDEGTINKVRTILTDIHKVTTSEPAPEPDAPDTPGVAQPLILCSQCFVYLPNINEYEYCLAHCTN